MAQGRAPVPIRVLWLIKGLGPGGAEQLLVGHAQAADRGAFTYEVAYLLPWKQHLVPQFDRAGVPTHCLAGGPEWDLRWAWQLRRLLMRHRFDIVHAHSPYPAAIARLVVRTLPRRQRPALMFTEHNEWLRHARLTRLANRLTAPLDAVHLAVSDGVRAALPARVRARTEVVLCGIDVDEVRRFATERDAVRTELGVGPGQVLVGTIANLRTEKAYPDLLEAARQVLARGLPVRFVAVGQGPLAAELDALHTDLGLGDSFRFLGYRQDARRVLAGFDLFALSSHHEGLPVSLMEALALGVPVVATSVGGVPEAVRHDHEGLLVPAGRPELLAEAIITLATDPDRRRNLARAAAARGDTFGVRPMARRLESVYRQITPLP